MAVFAAGTKREESRRGTITRVLRDQSGAEVYEIDFGSGGHRCPVGTLISAPSAPQEEEFLQ